MKTTLFPIRALTLLALASLAAGCGGSSGTPTPLHVDAGADTRDTGIDTRDVGSDIHDAGPDTGDVNPDVAVDAGTDAHEVATPAIAVAQGAVIVTAGSAAALNGVVVGSTSSTPFSITNTGNAPLTIGGVTVTGSDFSLGTAPAGSVAAGASTAFTIVFNPSSAGLKNGSVTITSNAATGDFIFPITAQATDVPVPAISVSVDGTAVASAGTAAYGSVAVGSSSAKTFTIHNGGTADLILSGAPVVTGGGFALTTSPASLTVAAGASVSAVITFAPTTTGDQTGSVTIANNSGATPSYTINLTGTGIPAPTGFTVTGAAGASSISGMGVTLQLTATAVPSGAANPGVTWSSGTATVATVDANGLVTAVGAGTSVITATAADASGVTGTLTITVTVPFVYFVKQALGTTTASLAGGALTVSSTYGTSGNAFKYVAPNFYGTTSNGFIAFPTPMTGDFSITAQVSVTNQIKLNNACGIGVGMTTGFNGTDSYAYTLMRNSTSATTPGQTNGYYVNATPGNSAASPAVAFTNNTPTQLTFSRTGTNVTFTVGDVATAPAANTNTIATSLLTNGTVYGTGPVYPAISFNNVAATITSLVIKDGTGATVYDSATGALVTYIPAALTLSSSTASINLNGGTPATVIATANAVGGAVSGVTAVATDQTVVATSVTNGATSSTISLTGLKGGFTTVTVTNTSDTNSATNTKTIAVSVFDYQATDGYGSLAAVAYPVPGATDAYTDGELALTFDAPGPTLSQGGTIKIMRASDGAEVDSIAFANETLTYGTTAINVGSQLARVSGNTVFFTPHLGKLAYGTRYYVAMPTISIAGTLNGVPFNGLSNLSTVATWSFTTRAAPTLAPTNITVDGKQTSTANFRTVGGALAAIPSGTTSATINIAAGTYNELVHYTGPGAATPLTVNIVGPANSRGDTCTIQYANGNTRNGTTQTRASFYLANANFVLQNITVKNTATRAALAQAESLYFNGPGFTLAANNSSFLSNQDTIQTSGRSWFYNCYVEGNVDFIWGTGDAALFENCNLRFVNDVGAATSYSLFVARTGTTIAAGGNGTVGKGYVLLNSGVTVDANVTAFFGRDAGVGSFYDQAALIGVTFTGAGTIGAGIWNVTTAPLFLGDPSIVGWKSAGCSGLNLGALTTAANTAAVINSQTAEYDTRDHILNRVVVVTSGAPAGFQAAAVTWDVSSLVTAFGATP